MSARLDSFLDLVRSADFIILDSETTGLRNAEICQLAIIDSAGKVLLDTYIKPTIPIPTDATAIHGITDEMVKDAPTWEHVSDNLLGDLLEGKQVIVYNVSFDRHVMRQLDWRRRIREPRWASSEWHCAMEAFAEYYGDYNNYRQSFNWKSLSLAANHMQVKEVDAHTALGDCLMTLEVVRAMASEKAE